MDSGENHPAHVAALGKQHAGHYLIRNAALVGMLERWCVRHADEVWVVADANRRRLEAVARNGTNIRLIRNMPDLRETPSPRPKPAGEQLRLIYLGILDAIRGLDMLLHAVAETHEVELVLVGDGSEHAALEALTRTLGIQSDNGIQRRVVLINLRQMRFQHCCGGNVARPDGGGQLCCTGENKFHIYIP